MILRTLQVGHQPQALENVVASGYGLHLSPGSSSFHTQEQLGVGHMHR